MDTERRILGRTYTTSKIRVSRLPWRSSRTFYDVFRLFFDAFDLFLEIFDKYEARIIAACERCECDRSQLIDRITSSQVSGLFDFDELVRLRLDYLRGFLDLSDDVFLGSQSRGVKGFQLHTKHLYHLVSMLALEELNVSIIAPGYMDLSEDENLKEILREVDREFPSKLREIRSKFEQSSKNLQAILTDHRHDRIFSRSIYLFERERMKRHFGDLDTFYKTYHPTGLLEGLRFVAEDFVRSGFEVQAREALSLLTSEVARLGKEHFAGREGLDVEWRRYRALQIELAPEDPGTALA